MKYCKTSFNVPFFKLATKVPFLLLHSCLYVHVRRIILSKKYFAHTHENIWATRTISIPIFETMKIRACSTCIQLKISFVSFVQYTSLFE